MDEERALAGHALLARDLAEGDEVQDEREIVVLPRRGQTPVVIDLDEAEKLGALGLNIEQICNYYGVSVQKLYRARQKFDALDAAILKGQAKGVMIAAQAVMKAIQAGNPISPFFYLKCRGGWQEKPEVRQERANSVHLYLPDNHRG